MRERILLPGLSPPAWRDPSSRRMHPSASLGVTVGIAAHAFLVVGLLLLGVHHAAPKRFVRVAALSVAWLALTAVVAGSGVLARVEARPPPFLFIGLGTLTVGIAVGASSLGASLARSIPLWALVGAQAFRVPLELVMHRAANEGTMPVEMSYSGFNFDIFSGLSAIVVAIALRRGAPPLLAALWSVVGSLLLAIIVTISILASPMIHAFGAGAHVNAWVTYPPFVWLPMVLVAAALAGHIIVFRHLALSRTDRARVAKVAGSVDDRPQ